MNNYIGKTCPFCKTPFQEGDDIVVCNSCDMPHHKECWIENQGCTTFGCMGTIKAADGAASSVTATEISYEDSNVFCTKCGAPNPSQSVFCSKCGNSLRAAAPTYTQANPANTNPYAYTQQNYNQQTTYNQPTYQQPTQAGQNYNQQPSLQQPTYNQPTYNQSNYAQPTQTQPNYNQQYGQNNNYYNQNNAYNQQSAYSQTAGIVDPDEAALIGTNQGYYIPKFLQMRAHNQSTSWNWVAFFFAPYWFIYRKMYGYGFAALGTVFLLTLMNIPVLSLLSLGGYITLGIFGNYIYMQWIKKQVNQVKAMSEPYKTQFIQKNGGVNSTALWLSIIGWIVLMGIIGM